jgi:regulator of nucleoside diphosphate kinase
MRFCFWAPGRRADQRKEAIMAERVIYVTEVDMARLRALLESTRASGWRDREHFQALEGELDQAQVVPPEAIPSDVVTMNSRVRVSDLTAGRQHTISIVFPSDANADDGKVSIVAPLGTALLGYRAGTTVQWTVPAGPRSLRIDEILYQPEAAGHDHR